MVADGFHSLLDGSSNIIALIGIRMASQPPDEDHPYGHQKFEILSAMAISLLLFLAAWHIVSDSLGRWSESGNLDPPSDRICDSPGNGRGQRCGLSMAEKSRPPIEEPGAARG